MNDTKQLKKLSKQLNLPNRKRELTKLDKIRAFYLEDRKLPKSLEDTREKLEKANGLLCSGYSKEQAKRFLMEQLNVSSSQAYKIIRESLEVFGDVTKSSKEGLRHVVTEMLMQVYNQARSAKNMEVAERVGVSIARINGLFNSTEQRATGGDVFNILFTSDPKALLADSQNTIDIEHDETE